jgi:predicted nucleic acid-binding protein
MRRMVGVLLVFGAASISAAIPLWHITRQDASGCQTYPCDPLVFLPYGNLAAELTLLGIVVILPALVIAALMLVGRLQHRAGSSAALQGR